MPTLSLTKVTSGELDCVRSFYWSVMDDSENLADTLRWKKNVYPSDLDWQTYINNGELYFIYEMNRLVGAVALTSVQGVAYKHIDWLTDVKKNEVLVIHLLAIDSQQQGRGLATAALNAVIMLAKEMGKKVVRLDAIDTNVPAQRLYEKYGFKKCGWAQAYYESVGFAGFYFYEYSVV